MNSRLWTLAFAVIGLWCSNAKSQTAVPAPNADLPTLFVVGDSTARNNVSGAKGWGDSIASYFDTTKINVINRARAGRSSRTFVTEELWSGVLKEMKKGDFVLIQFGHNDSGPVDTARARGSLPGTGEETQEVSLPNGTKEVVHTYGWYLRKMINDTKAKEATPIVLSLTVRNIWKESKVERDPGRFGEWAADVAKVETVPFLDLTTIIADQYEKLGQEKVKEMFGPDYAHTSPAGADFNAACMVLGLKLLKHPLINFLAEKGNSVTTEFIR